MDNQLKHLISELESAINTKDFFDISESVTEEISALDNPFSAVQPILLLMEKNPNADFGSPGPLVHFLETFYKQGYEEELMKSIDRRSTKHTVWMLNRIINGSEREKKDYYLSKLDEISSYPNIDDTVVDLVNHFKEFQLK